MPDRESESYSSPPSFQKISLNLLDNLYSCTADSCQWALDKHRDLSYLTVSITVMGYPTDIWRDYARTILWEFWFLTMKGLKWLTY
jgi:hypothetical protein